MKRRTSFILLLTALAVPNLVSAQARVEAVFPDSLRIVVQRLGTSAMPELARAGMEDLVPGDFVISPDTAFLELRCPRASETVYRLRGPFRVVIDVPRSARCHINLLNGEATVLAEEPTEQTVGGVTMGSKGTQYSFVVRREATGEVNPRVIVFDGRVELTSPAGRLELNPGVSFTHVVSSMQNRTVSTTHEQLRRWAGFYATFDLQEAVTRGASVGDRRRTFDRLSNLHYEVLANPADTTRRVALAKAQLEYRVAGGAQFNLRRVGVTSSRALTRWQIDTLVMRSMVRGRENGAAAARH